MKKPIKIGISGANRPSKTATAEALTKRFNRTTLVPDFEQAYEDIYHKMNPYGLPPMAFYPAHELRQMQRPKDLVICDGTMVDTFLSMHNPDANYTDAELRHVERVMMEHAKTYDLVIYQPIDASARAAPLSNFPLADPQRLDNITRSIYKLVGVNVIEVPGTIDQQADFITQALKIRFDLETPDSTDKKLDNILNSLDMAFKIA